MLSDLDHDGSPITLGGRALPVGAQRI